MISFETQIAAVFNDTFPTNTGHMSVWPSRKLRIDKAVNLDDSSSSGTSTKRTVISAVEPKHQRRRRQLGLHLPLYYQVMYYRAMKCEVGEDIFV